MTKANNFDLASLDTKEACNKGYELELRHPVTNAPLGTFITVVGSESDVFQSHLRKRADERLRKQFRTQRRAGEEAPTMEQTERDAIEVLAACTLSWRDGDTPAITVEGKALECTEANARFVYGKLKWIREQVDEAIGDLGNFMPA